MYISLSEKYAGRVEGLCGNFNGIASDVFSVNGMEAGTANEFGNSYMTESCPPIDDEASFEPCEVHIVAKIQLLDFHGLIFFVISKAHVNFEFNI